MEQFEPIPDGAGASTSDTSNVVEIGFDPGTSPLEFLLAGALAWLAETCCAARERRLAMRRLRLTLRAGA